LKKFLIMPISNKECPATLFFVGGNLRPLVAGEPHQVKINMAHDKYQQYVGQKKTIGSADKTEGSTEKFIFILILD
jgi:hypothetical protein